MPRSAGPFTGVERPGGDGNEIRLSCSRKRAYQPRRAPRSRFTCPFLRCPARCQVTVSAPSSGLRRRRRQSFHALPSRRPRLARKPSGADRGRPRTGALTGEQARQEVDQRLLPDIRAVRAGVDGVDVGARGRAAEGRHRSDVGELAGLGPQGAEGRSRAHGQAGQRAPAEVRAHVVPVLVCRGDARRHLGEEVDAVAVGRHRVGLTAPVGARLCRRGIRAGGGPT
jgi:hypothetical protein